MAGPSASRFGVALYGEDRQIPDDFAGTEAPKLKFNFTLSFQFTSMMYGVVEGADDPYAITFGIKQIPRPAPNVMYEDVNFYNFMTKVATKIEFGVVTVTLYDDRTNKAHYIFQKYMESISPITNVGRDFAPLMDTSGQERTASIGPLDNSARHGPIKSIRVTHLTNHLGKAVIYDFINPKIQNVILDELDMTQSDVSTITFTFIYDSYNVTHTGDPGTSKRAVDVTLEEIPNELVDGMEETITTAIRPTVDNSFLDGTAQEAKDRLKEDGIPDPPFFFIPPPDE